MSIGKLGRINISLPWGQALGAGRSLVALSVAGTLLFTPPGVLFSALYTGSSSEPCLGVRGISAFCLVPPAAIGPVQYVFAALLVIFATGFWPSATAIPFAYIVVSFAWSSNLVDGGDQVAEILAVLLVPVGLTDPRANHWLPLNSRAEFNPSKFKLRGLVAATFATVIRVQVSAIYLFACLGKFTSSTWTDGSAIYYWFRHPNFGVPQWAAAPALWVTSLPIGTAAVSWGTLALEFSLGISMLIPVRWRVAVLLPIGILFHLGIALFMGITSFSFAMIGALFLLLVPPGWSLDRTKFPEYKIPRSSEHSGHAPTTIPADEQPSIV